MNTQTEPGAGLLAEAFNYPFGEPVTGYLTDAVIVSCCGFGVMYRYICLASSFTPLVGRAINSVGIYLKCTEMRILPFVA